VSYSSRISDGGLNVVGSRGSEGHSSHSDHPCHSPQEVPNERGDFDDGANALWSLYGKEAQAHDEMLFQSLLDDMNRVPTFVRILARVQPGLEFNFPAFPQAGLFVAILTSFLIDSLQNLQAGLAQQAVYYHQQSVAMLAQISQQLASIAPQVPIPPTSPAPYPPFCPSKPNTRANAYWLIGLVCSLARRSSPGAEGDQGAGRRNPTEPRTTYFRVGAHQSRRCSLGGLRLADFSLSKSNG
jgi:hypothetical protein